MIQLRFLLVSHCNPRATVRNQIVIGNVYIWSECSPNQEIGASMEKFLAHPVNSTFVENLDLESAELLGTGIVCRIFFMLVHARGCSCE